MKTNNQVYCEDIKGEKTMNKEKEFVVLINNRITFIEDMKYIKSYKTVNKRVFVTFIDDTEDDFYFHEIKIREQKMKNDREFNFYMNNYSDNGEEILIDTLEFNSLSDAIEHMREEGYNRVEFADKEATYE